MAAILKVWFHIRTLTPSIDEYLHEEQSCKISSRSNLKWQEPYEEVAPTRRTTTRKTRWVKEVKVKECASYLWKSISQLWSVTCRMGSVDHTVLPSTRHKRTHPTSTPARQAGTRFTDHLRMEGWVSPGPGCKEQLAHGCYATAWASETRTHDLANASRAATSTLTTRLSCHH